MVKTFKSHITNAQLLTYPGDYFAIYQDGQLINKDEFIKLKMKEYNLKTPILVRRALASVGVE